MSQFHLIAPSGYCINQSAAQRGSRLEEAGHQVANQQVILVATAFCRNRSRASGGY
jgi:muramoyltetrapeptide carboxypeptidase LdcA involved in peptidoglycan recycling